MSEGGNCIARRALIVMKGMSGKRRQREEHWI